MPREKSVGAVVFKKGGGGPRFLLLHYTAGHWGFPKGHVEQGESEEQTLFREVAEETGLEDVELVRGFKQRNSYFFQRAGATVSKEVIFYLLRAEGRVTISPEHQGFQWLAFREALQRLSFKGTREVLGKANSFLQQGRLGEFR